MLRIGLERARRLGEAGWVAALTLINAFGSFWLGEWDQLLRDIEEAEEESERGCSRRPARHRSLLGPGRARRFRGQHEASVGRRVRQTEGQSSPTGHAYIRVYPPPGSPSVKDGSTTPPRAHWLRHASHGRSSRSRPWSAASRQRSPGIRTSSTRSPSCSRTAAFQRPLRCRSRPVRGVPPGNWRSDPGGGLAFSTSAEMLRRLGYRVELALLAIARAKLIRPPDPATTEAVAEAREILTGLGAVPLLKLLDDAVAGSGTARLSPPARRRVCSDPGLPERAAGARQRRADQEHDRDGHPGPADRDPAADADPARRPPPPRAPRSDRRSRARDTRGSR